MSSHHGLMLRARVSLADLVHLVRDGVQGRRIVQVRLAQGDELLAGFAHRARLGLGLRALAQAARRFHAAGGERGGDEHGGHDTHVLSSVTDARLLVAPRPPVPSIRLGASTADDTDLRSRSQALNALSHPKRVGCRRSAQTRVRSEASGERRENESAVADRGRDPPIGSG